ncbi:MAG: hypothetical protein OEZ58_21825 [Gammaproteobacteria bacterium]|nr:hypothetical protein [Gammaproteobacteria bacterium]
MKLRSKWHSNKARTVEEQASAMAFIIWSLAMDRIKDMEKNGFQIHMPERTLNVIGEMVAFFVQLMDRWTFDSFTQEQRTVFVTEMAKKLATTMQDNRLDAQGPGEYKKDFVDMLNQRMSAYAETTMVDDEPAYPMYLVFAKYITEQLTDLDQAWVTQAMVEVEGPESVKVLRRGMGNLFKSETTS